MRKLQTGVEAPRGSFLARRTTAIVLAGGLSVGLAGCASNGSGNNSEVQTCKAGWDAVTAITNNPSVAHTEMQTAIAQLLGKVDKSGAEEDGYGYYVKSIPNDLVGAANGVLHQFPQDVYVGRSSALQSYGNEVCRDDLGSVYLTPAYLSAVGSLAAAGIKVDLQAAQGK